MPERGHVLASEWRRVGLFALAVMLLTSAPYFVGGLAAGDGWTYGGFLFGADDGYSYLAKMRLGARGDWLFTVRYTSEPHEGALLFLPYILLGKLAGLAVPPDDPGLFAALVIVFHAARIVFGLLLIPVSYRFVAEFLRAPGLRFLALVLITLGGGLGWLLSLAGLGDLFGSLPVDFYVPEGYSFLILYGLPHLALARAALLGGLLLLFRALGRPDTPRAWLPWSVLAGLAWGVMGLSVPFYIAVVYAVLGAWGLALWRRERRFPWRLFWRAVIAALVVLPVLAYTGTVFLSNDVLGRWSGQNQLPSPHPLHYIFGYSVLAIPAVAALRWAWRKGTGEDAPYLLLAAWIVIVPVLVYLPINVQRRLSEGVIVPLVVLAVAGLRLLISHRQQWRRARTLVLLLALPTAILLWLGGLVSALQPDRPLFRPDAELQALDTLDVLAPPDAVVLSVKETGSVIPARTDLIAYVGHVPETLDSEAKEQQAARFYAGALDDAARWALLAQVDYVFYGPLEREADPAPGWDAGLRLLEPFDPSDPYRVYEVLRRD